MGVCITFRYIALDYFFTSVQGKKAWSNVYKTCSPDETHGSSVHDRNWCFLSTGESEEEKHDWVTFCMFPALSSNNGHLYNFSLRVHKESHSVRSLVGRHLDAAANHLYLPKYINK